MQRHHSPSPARLLERAAFRARRDAAHQLASLVASSASAPLRSDVSVAPVRARSPTPRTTKRVRRDHSPPVHDFLVIGDDLEAISGFGSSETETSSSSSMSSFEDLEGSLADVLSSRTAPSEA